MTAEAATTKKPSAARRISAFLEANPAGPLRIATGYASFWGLAWLAQHCGSRESIDLLIGDCGARHFLRASPDDVEAAVEFVGRDDVNIWEFEQGNRSRVHSKVWVAGRSVLSGSANLTKQGFYKNSETLGEYHGHDKYRAFKQVQDLIWSASPAGMIIEAYAECLAENSTA